MGFKMSELIIYKANSLVVSRYDLTEQETKLILYSVAKLNPTSKGNELDRSVSIPYTEYAKAMGLADNLAWTNLNNAIKNLMSRTIEIVNPDPNAVISKVIFQWVNKAEFNEKNQAVELTFSKEIQPFLFNLKEFIKYKLENVKSLNNKYSMRIYEILLKSLNESKTTKKDVVISLSELKNLLVLDNNYPDFKEFNRRVISVAVNDINKNSDLKIKVSKQGRPVDTLIFSVEKVTPLKQLDLVNAIEEKEQAEKNALPKKRRATQKQRDNEIRFRSVMAMLDTHALKMIALTEQELKFLKSAKKQYEQKLDYGDFSEKQIAFLDGITAKYRPKI